MDNEQLNPIFDDKDLTPPRNYPRMKNRLKEIVEYIETRFGVPFTELELNPSEIKKVVEQCFNEIKHYMTDIYSVTVPYAQCVDLKDYNISSVESIYRGNDSILTGLPFSIPAVNLGNVTGVYNLDQYADAINVKRNLNILSTDMDFVWDKPNRKLYITANPNVPSYVTINFIPEYFYVDDIREQYWDTQLRKLSLGTCQVIVGDIRNKYKSNSTKFTMNGDDLISRGQAEIDSVRAYLDENKDIFTVLN